jgi:enamine deaminase RidA (YjgF/YER057c/UK114 family)
MQLERTNYSSGAPLEDKVGYSRMVKVGPFISIGGTTSVLPDGSVYGEGSAYEQTKFILEKMIKLLAEAGGAPGDVIKIKGYLTDMANAAEAGRAYSELFGDIRPLLTFVGTTMLNRPAQLIELELEAVSTSEPA